MFGNPGGSGCPPGLVAYTTRQACLLDLTGVRAAPSPPDPAGFVSEGDEAIQFLTEGSLTIPITSLKIQVYLGYGNANNSSSTEGGSGGNRPRPGRPVLWFGVEAFQYLHQITFGCYVMAPAITRHPCIAL